MAWGYNIGGFERHYSGWQIESPDGLHLAAQRKIGGCPDGRRLRARALDELAVLIEAVCPQPASRPDPRTNQISHRNAR